MQNRIDKVLNEQGKTYKDLVPLTGLNEYGIGQMAKAGDDETFGAWLSIARALGVSPAYLVGWSDDWIESSEIAHELGEDNLVKNRSLAKKIKYVMDNRSDWEAGSKKIKSLSRRGYRKVATS